MRYIAFRTFEFVVRTDLQTVGAGLQLSEWGLCWEVQAERVQRVGNGHGGQGDEGGDVELHVGSRLLVRETCDLILILRII